MTTGLVRSFRMFELGENETTIKRARFETRSATACVCRRENHDVVAFLKYPQYVQQ